MDVPAQNIKTGWSTVVAFKNTSFLHHYILSNIFWRKTPILWDIYQCWMLQNRIIPHNSDVFLQRIKNCHEMLPSLKINLNWNQSKSKTHTLFSAITHKLCYFVSLTKANTKLNVWWCLEITKINSYFG